MLVTNSTSKKLRFSIVGSISEDEMEEKFAYIVQKGCSLNMDLTEGFVVSEEDD